MLLRHLSALFLTFFLMLLGLDKVTAQSYTRPSLRIYSHSTSKIGIERIQSLVEDGEHASLLSLSQDIRIRFRQLGQGPRLDFSYHFEIDLEQEDQDHLLRDNLDRINFSMVQPYTYGSLGIGVQTLSWGESVSLPILDLSNPRNMSHPKGFYDKAGKISIPMLTGELSVSAFQLSTYISFWPKPARAPDELAGFSVKQPDEKRIFEDFEGGLRIGRTLDNLDLKLLYLRHEARIPSFYISAFADEGDLILNQKKIDTFGLSFSWAGFENLLRGDLRYSPNHPVNGVMQRKTERDLLQGIVGYDYSPNINTIIGLELHYDDWGLMPYHFVDGPWAANHEEQARLYWLGTNTRLNFFSNRLETRLLFLRGISNSDMLLRARAEYKPTDKLGFNLEVQKTSFNSSSPRYVLGEQERILLGLELFL